MYEILFNGSFGFREILMRYSLKWITLYIYTFIDRRMLGLYRDICMYVHNSVIDIFYFYISILYILMKDIKDVSRKVAEINQLSFSKTHKKQGKQNIF